MDQKRLDIRLLRGLEERQEEITLWLKEHSRALLIGGSLFLFVVLLSIVLLFKGKEDWGKTRAEVEKDLSRIERLEVADRGELLTLAKSIEKKLQTSSEFAPLYEGRLAQALVQSGGAEEAEKLLVGQSERITSPLPSPFTIFSESSLMIAKGDFEGAYDKELSLQRELQLSLEERGSERWNDTLFAYNLVRRALLSDLLGKERETKALKNEISTLLQQKEGNGRRDALEGLVEAYRIGSKTLLTYLDKEEINPPHLASESRPQL